MPQCNDCRFPAAAYELPGGKCVNCWKHEAECMRKERDIYRSAFVGMTEQLNRELGHVVPTYGAMENKIA